MRDDDLTLRIMDALNRSWRGRVTSTHDEPVIKEEAVTIKIVSSITDDDWTREHRIIQAYSEIHSRENRPPLIGELLKELGIHKPADGVERREVSNQERAIRKTLKKFVLPLSPGKRGRRWPTKAI